MRVRVLPYMACVLLSATCRAQSVTFSPREDGDVVLHNPDMGWVLYEKTKKKASYRNELNAR